MLADLFNNIGKLVDILSEQQEERPIQFGRLFEVLDMLMELNKRKEKEMTATDLVIDNGLFLVLSALFSAMVIFRCRSIRGSVC
jgi:hypothetical protein